MSGRTLLFIIAAIFFLPVRAEAANLYFEPSKTNVAPGDEFQVRVLIDTEDKFINAIGGEVLTGGKFTITRVSDGNSIVNLWVERPRIESSSGSVSFSGITPGGFAGSDGLIMTLTIIADKTPGSRTGSLSFGKEAQVFISDGRGVPAPLTFGKATLTIDPKRAKSEPLAVRDTVPPEEFTPEITRSPELFNNRYVLVFGTQDKRSGIDHYEVLEIRSPPLALDANLPWVRAESPYILKDQKLKSAIFVKALDFSGNQRIAAVPPLRVSFMKTPLFYAIIGLLMAVPIWFILRRFTKRFQDKK